MRTRLVCICMTLLIIMAGCQVLYEQAQREKVDNDILVKIAGIQHDMLSFRLGAFDGFYEGKEGTLTVETVAIRDKLKMLASVDPNTMTEYQLGYSWGLQANLLEKLIKASVEILRYLP